MARTAPAKPLLDLSILTVPKTLFERDEDSPVFGMLTIRQLTRREMRSLPKLAADPDDPKTIDGDLWNATIFHLGVRSKATGKALFESSEAMLDLPAGTTVWAEIVRIDELILNELSEVGKAALKSEDPPADAG